MTGDVGGTIVVSVSESAPAEPVLTVRPPFYLRRRFLRRFVPVISLAIVGIVAQVGAGTTDLPFQRLVTLDGVGGSKIEYLEDAVVREQLLRHHVALRLTRVGSRESARVLSPDVDFYFPSGQPAAELVTRRRQTEQAYSSPHRVFVSPIVLATYREYAETLRAAGVATPQANQDRALPHYYDLDLARFLDLARGGRSWNDLGIAARGFTNGNTVLAQTPDAAPPTAPRPTSGWSRTSPAGACPNPSRMRSVSRARSNRCCGSRACPPAMRTPSTSSPRDGGSSRSA
jgi:hypothetical protein